MKKNEHYFPTIEYSKDSAEPLGWKKIIHEYNEGGAREEMAPDEMEVEGGNALDQENTESGAPDTVGQA